VTEIPTRESCHVADLLSVEDRIGSACPSCAVHVILEPPFSCSAGMPCHGTGADCHNSLFGGADACLLGRMPVCWDVTGRQVWSCLEEVWVWQHRAWRLLCSGCPARGFSCRSAASSTCPTTLPCTPRPRRASAWRPILPIRTLSASRKSFGFILQGRISPRRLHWLPKALFQGVLNVAVREKMIEFG
jgi:hypothetical protein